MFFAHEKMREYLRQLERDHDFDSIQDLPEADHFQAPSVVIGGVYPLESGFSKGEEIGGHDDIMPEEKEYRGGHFMFNLTYGEVVLLSKTKVAIRHMRAYIRFVDEFIMPLRRDVFEGALANSSTSIPSSLGVGEPAAKPLIKIRFQDLWYLFNHGELLFSPNIAYADSGAEDLSRAGPKNHYTWRVLGVDFPKARADDQLVYNIEVDPTPLDLGGLKQAKPEYALKIKTYYIHYDGVSFGPVEHEFIFEPFEGERYILQLPCYPARFHPDYKFHMDRLEKRGKKLQKCIQEKYVNASGWTLTCSPAGNPMETSENSQKLAREHVDSQVVVDFAEACSTNFSWSPEFITDINCDSVDVSSRIEDLHVCWWSDRHRIKRLGWVEEHLNDISGTWARSTKFIDVFRKWNNGRGSGYFHTQPPPELLNLTDPDDLVLLPRSLYGYVLRERRFAVLDVETITEVEKQGDALSKLVLQDRYSATVESLVDVHFMDKTLKGESSVKLQSQDIIHGKGRGLVILLHGSPGVGKTATAEALAMKHDKALFSITCGDLGLSPSAVEASLRSIFRLANRWDCILLLDEADIFLSRRGADSTLERNALVSVFLRMLEYYDGVLFLTTNRVGILDPAFKSRIHLSLFYPDLTNDKILRIFRRNLNRLVEIEESRACHTGETAMEVSVDNIMEDIEKEINNPSDGDSSKTRWNGRMVRNTVQTASSLARHEAKKGQKPRASLNITHFQSVIHLIRKFDNYMEDIHSVDESTMAANANERAPVPLAEATGDAMLTASRAQRPDTSASNWNTSHTMNGHNYHPGYMAGGTAQPQQFHQPHMPQPYYAPYGHPGTTNPGYGQPGGAFPAQPGNFGPVTNSQPMPPPATFGPTNSGYGPHGSHNSQPMPPPATFGPTNSGYGPHGSHIPPNNQQPPQQNYQQPPQSQLQQNYQPQPQSQPQPQLQHQSQPQSQLYSGYAAVPGSSNNPVGAPVMGQGNPATFSGQGLQASQAPQATPIISTQAGQNGTNPANTFVAQGGNNMGGPSHEQGTGNNQFVQ